VRVGGIDQLKVIDAGELDEPAGVAGAGRRLPVLLGEVERDAVVGCPVDEELGHAERQSRRRRDMLVQCRPLGRPAAEQVLDGVVAQVSPRRFGRIAHAGKGNG